MSRIESILGVLRRSARRAGRTAPPPPEEFETCRALWAALPNDLKEEDEVRIFREGRPAARWVAYLAAAAILLLGLSAALILASRPHEGGRESEELAVPTPARLPSDAVSDPGAAAPAPSARASLPPFGEVSVAFTRGDSDADGEVGIYDALSIYYYLFGPFENGAGNPTPADRVGRCLDAADANDDGRVDVADGITILACLFHETGPLPDPFNACGCDETEDALGCTAFTACR